MWSSLTSYFTSAAPPKPQAECVVETDDLDNDWVIVNKSGQEISKQDVQNEEKLDESICDSQVSRESQHSPIIFLDLSNTSCSPHQTPPLSPCKIEDDWIITPPPCFTLNCPPDIEESPFENLLIEHPSMSVYGKIPHFSGKHRHVEKLPKPSCDFVSTEPKCSEMSLEKQKSEKKQANDHVPKHAYKDYAAYMKFLNEKIDKYEQIENIKPSQKAKWKNEQRRFRSSYMTRQNRVCRYQFRNCDNQRKSFVVKPFGEKCKHGF